MVSGRASDFCAGKQLPGQGQAQPVPYTHCHLDPYRVGAGLAPALVAACRVGAGLAPALALIFSARVAASSAVSLDIPGRDHRPRP